MSSDVIDESTRARLKALGFEVDWVDQTGSTNADLVRAAGEGAPAGTVRVADHQTAGRGRLDRSWVAPPGASLLVSLLWRPSLEPEQLHLVATAVAVAGAVACQEVAGVEPGLKWPNDLVLGSGEQTRKLGGILAESVLDGGRLDAVVVGMGLNVAWPDVLPEDLASIATSLNHHSTWRFDRTGVLIAWLEALAPLLGSLGSSTGRTELLERYRERCATLGQRVRVEMAGETVEARAVDLDAVGRLVLVSEDGSQRVVDSGDVIHLRPGT